MSAQVGRGSLACLNISKQQVQNLTNNLKFHESCMVSDKKKSCVCPKFEDIGYFVDTFLVLDSYCSPREYFVMFTWKGRGIASDVSLLFLVIRYNCSSTWPFKRVLLYSFPSNGIAWRLPTSVSPEMLQYKYSLLATKYVMSVPEFL